ncbi:class A beta-lactamase-related serine hydrolase [Sphingomonas sp. 7/4-4]|uniref:serine hydrolase n=1 Tax=Sphingomonas sp. 7/4-4 TaxID=3018446 RepID=UPI0022F3F9BB|nr:serine hydrolase [Sphingomonas sp. 7/4-4]WBY07234.1 class A beta-lactamase-related serine hydrolase [Sphingomonas sp. 7/4-4]
MKKIQGFSKLERALTVAGLGPAMLLGCAVHEDIQLAAYLPAPSYSVLMPFPAAAAAPSRPRVAAPVELVTSIDAITRNFSGLVGVAVTSVDDGWIAGNHTASRPLPQQSVSKLWVTMTVLDAVDRGVLRLDDPLTITRADFTLFHQPVAALVKGDAGYTSTIGEIMRRAMQMSDNTCNDKLLHLVGGPQAVRDFIARKQLGTIRFGPGEKLLQAGTAGLEWKPEYSTGNAFAVARSRLSPAVRLAAYEAYVKDPPDGAAPASIAGALARLYRGELLSANSTAWLLATMDGAKTGKARVRGAVPPGWLYGHKTGTGQDLGGRTAGFNDVGILTAPDGRSYAVAVMIGDTSRPIRERQLLMQAVARAIVAHHQPSGSMMAGGRPSR